MIYMKLKLSVWTITYLSYIILSYFLILFFIYIFYHLVLTNVPHTEPLPTTSTNAHRKQNENHLCLTF